MSDASNETGHAVKDRVAAAIETIRPFIQSDGGDIELVDVDDQGVVQVRLHGACVGCPASQMTLKLGVERNLKEKVPEVSEVVCV